MNSNLILVSIQTELLDSEKEKASKVAIRTLADYDKNAIGFSDCSFSWDSFENRDGLNKHARKAFRLRFDGEVLFKRGGINLVVGPTASGKVGSLFDIHTSNRLIVCSDVRSDGSPWRDVLQSAWGLFLV